MKKITPTTLAELLFTETDGKSEAESQKIVKSFVTLLAKKRMLEKGDLVVEAYRQLVQQEKGIVEVTATVHEHMSAHTKDTVTTILKKELHAKDILINEKVDQSILGGIKIKYGDTVIDSTLLGRLKQMKATLFK
jgi:F-type H+-transporting ATPase subunit delta